MTEGEQIRDFMLVESVASAFLDRATLIDWSSVAVQVLNLSSGEPISICTFAQRCWKHWDASGKLILGQIPYRSSEVMRYVAGENLIRIPTTF